MKKIIILCLVVFLAAPQYPPPPPPPACPNPMSPPVCRGGWDKKFEVWDVFIVGGLAGCDLSHAPTRPTNP